MVHAASPGTSSALGGLWSRRAIGLPESPRLDNTDDVASRISFVYGFPDPGSLPATQVAAATDRALTKNGRWALQYGDTAGYRGLIDALLAKLRRDQRIEAGRENTIVTAGGSQALQLVLDALVDWGDTVVTEAPTWMGAIQAFKNVGARVVGVPVDDGGTDTAALARELDRLRDAGVQPKLIYLISNFQNPTGISTGVERRRRIVELAREHRTLILEDDAYFDLRYAGESLPPIYALDDGGSTLYLGTLSKTMGAGMRLGWLLAPAEFITRLTALKIDGGTNVFGAHVAAEWLPEHLETHVRELREVYRRRRDLMLLALERHMPAGSSWTRPEGGFFVWVTLPPGVDTTRMLPQACERGVEFLPGATCYPDDRGRDQLRLSFSFAADDQIDEGIRIIGEIAKGELLEARPL
jgi:2-aminoadipate transaminase